MIVHLHCFSWNDAALLPHFLARHAGWVDFFHFWDMESTDGSRAILEGRPDVKLHTWHADGTSLVNSQRRQFDEAWKQSKGQADWVVMLHADEHLHHPDLRAYLERRSADGVTAIRAIGYEMVGDVEPAALDPTRLLCDQLTQGCRSPGLDRLVMFAPDALSATHFAPGQHHAWPEGHVVWPASAEVLLLRFQMLSEAHFLATCRARAEALQPEDRKHGWSAHLDWSDEQLAGHMAALRARAATVPGLGDRAEVPPEDYRHDERTVERSGLFDADWYEAQNPDITAHQFDALTHYCEYGWREGRQPNPYFDAAWYAQHCGHELPADRNPLLHYLEVGEPARLAPSPHFDPAWYRSAYQLDDRTGALRHFLQHRTSGEVSPRPGFDVGAWLAAHPQLREQRRDPYLHHLAATEAGAAAVVPMPAHGAPLPQWQPLRELLLGEDAPDDPGAAVPMASVEDAVRQFVPWLPFDAGWYLRANPDVAEAVQDGVFESAHAHFVEHGFFEGRSPLPEPGAVP